MVNGSRWIFLPPGSFLGFIPLQKSSRFPNRQRRGAQIEGIRRGHIFKLFWVTFSNRRAGPTSGNHHQEIEGSNQLLICIYIYRYKEKNIYISWRDFSSPRNCKWKPLSHYQPLIFRGRDVSFREGYIYIYMIMHLYVYLHTHTYIYIFVYIVLYRNNPYLHFCSVISIDLRSKKGGKLSLAVSKWLVKESLSSGFFPKYAAKYRWKRQLMLAVGFN